MSRKVEIEDFERAMMDVALYVCVMVVLVLDILVGG